MHIFISYAREDGQSLALQLYKDLSNRDIVTWIDTQGMVVGRSWEMQVEEAIRQAAYLLLIVTPGILKSEVVQDEIAFANQHRVAIIPLYYTEVEEFPLRLVRLQYIDFRNPENYQENLGALYRRIQDNNTSNLPIIQLSITHCYKKYLHSLICQLRDLPFERINPDASQSITMDKIWTSLDVDYQESPNTNAIRIPALEAISICHNLLVLGDPGSGKSSLLRYLSICLASATLQNPNLSILELSNLDPNWNRGLLCPVYLDLLEFAEYGFQSQRQNQISEFIIDQAETTSEGFGSELRQKIENGDCIILFDGLDEVPLGDQRRQKVLLAILEFSKENVFCPLIISSRTNAYHQSGLQISSFKEVTIVPFTEFQVESFIEKWYSSLPLSLHQAKLHKEKLKEKIRKDPAGLGELAQQPLLLTFLASLYTYSGKTLPTTRAELYEHIIQLMLKEWESTRTIVDPETGKTTRITSSLTDFLGLPHSYGLLTEVLQEIAYNAHLRQPNRQERGVIQVGQIANRLYMMARQYKKANFNINPFQIEEDINARTGLLQPHGLESYRFPHLTIQEFLAALHICRKENYPYVLQELVYEDAEKWREVLFFTSEIVAERQGKVCLLPLLDALLTVPENIQMNMKSDAEYMAIYFAGLLTLTHDLLSYKTKLWSTVFQEIRQGLKSLVDHLATTPIIRADAADILAILGDDRPGIGLRSDGLPDVDWCYIPAGEFLFGGLDGTLSYQLYLPDFWMSRYPVTNAQFQAFIEDLGYSNQWRECWTNSGWEWLKRLGVEKAIRLSFPFSLPNHPRVGVNFFEAYAFTMWISKRLGFEIRLPFEPEWEKTARGPDNLLYTWGNKFDPDAANILTAQINSTCAVGLFPPNVYRVYDLIGNISEWCLTLWDSQYGYPMEQMDNNPEGEYQRIIRGSAYTNNPEKSTTMYRHWEEAQDRKLIHGFRLVTRTKPTD